MFKRGKDLWVIGEKEVFADLTQIVDIAVEANKLVLRMFELNYDEQALTKLMHEVQALEKKSDEISFKISEDITGGAISPNIIDNLLECVQFADDIVDKHFYISRELHRMAKAYASGYEFAHADWDSTYQNMLGFADKALVCVKQALSTSSIEKIMEIRKEIQTFEEQADDIKDAGFDKLYCAAPQLHYLQFNHYSDLLHRCDDVLDACEDISDLLVSIITSILK